MNTCKPQVRLAFHDVVAHREAILEKSVKQSSSHLISVMKKIPQFISCMFLSPANRAFITPLSFCSIRFGNFVDGGGDTELKIIYLFTKVRSRVLKVKHKL